MHVTLSLNGRELSGKPGDSILELARQAGETIPTLCHHPLLTGAGACRVCLVEEVKSGRMLASCITPISDGMEILTHSPKAVQARRGVLELILSDHPSACVICSKGNNCVLRSLAKEHDICDPDLEPIRRWRPMQEVNPFIVRDLSKCIMCGRCIRVCRDFEAAGAIEYMNRGYNTHPGTSTDAALEGSECNFCGSCIVVCPTDALARRDRQSMSSGNEFQQGICSYCSVGCRLEYEVADGRVIGARGMMGSPVNSLSLCVRGFFGQDALASEERLTEPLVKQSDGTHMKASWKEALTRIADRIQDVVARYGPTGIGVVVGTQCSNEDHYVATRFARSVLRTPHCDNMARWSSGTVVQGLVDSLQTIQSCGSFGTIREARTIVLIAARPDYTHPVVARDIRWAVRHNGAALVQMDPLTTGLSPFARIRLRDHMDVLPAILAELMRDMAGRNLIDEEFLRQNVVKAEEFLSRLKPAPGAPAARNDLRCVADLITGGERTVFILGPMLGKVAHGYIISRLAVDLSLLCGQPDNLLLLHEGSNEAGAWELEWTLNRLPGLLFPANADFLENIKRLWGDDTEFQRGMDAMGMIREAEKEQFKAVIFLGVDPLAVFPDSERTRKALLGTDLVVRSGMFPAIGGEVADFVLPTASITETDGTYVNSEGRVQRVSPLTGMPGNARPTARLLLDLAGLMGSPMGYVTAKDIFEEMRALSPRWNAITWEEAELPGGIAFRESEASPGSDDATGRRPKLVPYTPVDSFSVSHRAPVDEPWRVLTEEHVLHPGDGVVSARSRLLAGFGNSAVVRMNPADAERIGAHNGKPLQLISKAGEARARLEVDSEVPLSTVVIPSGGPTHILQRLVPWPEEFCPAYWDRIFVAVNVPEEE